MPAVAPAVPHAGFEATQLRVGFAILALAAAPRLAEAECEVYRDAAIGLIARDTDWSDSFHLPFVVFGTATPVGGFTTRGELVINSGSITGTSLLTDRRGNSIRMGIVAGELRRVFGGVANITLSAEFQGGTGIYRGVTGGFDGRGMLVGRILMARSLGEICFGGDRSSGGKAARLSL